jgi:hypothetical protein
MAVNIPGELTNDDQEKLREVLEKGGSVILRPDGVDGKTNIVVSVSVTKSESS